MSEILAIENFLGKKLKKELGPDKGSVYYSNYIQAKKTLVQEILPEIKKIEKNLTDHGPQHIDNVLDNAYKLLGEDIYNLSAFDLYTLCIIILFHDVGIIWGRKDHHKNISIIYDYVRKDHNRFRDEKILVTTAVRAHTGEAIDGSKDTLKDIKNEDYFLDGNSIQLQDLAAILRFSDELAEGRQRTSNFMIENNLFSKNSRVFHQFSNITRISIARETNRIVINYDINIPALNKREISDFKELMKFCYNRIIKLDEERKYNKHYTNYLSSFKTTSAKFQIYVNDELRQLDLNPIILDDLTIPGQNSKSITEIDNNYVLEHILKKINGTKNKKRNKRF